MQVFGQYFPKYFKGLYSVKYKELKRIKTGTGVRYSMHLGNIVEILSGRDRIRPGQGTLINNRNNTIVDINFIFS